MFEEYIGRSLTEKEIFNSFVDLAVKGHIEKDHCHDGLHIIIDRVGKAEDIDAAEMPGLVVYGRRSREGHGVIWNSNWTAEEIVGVWNTSVTADGEQSNERLIFKADGTGLFAESSSGPYWLTPIEWYMENGLLVIDSDRSNLYQGTPEYEVDVIVPCLSGQERHFTKMGKLIYGLSFYRPVGNKRLEDRIQEAEAAHSYLTRVGNWG